MQDDPTLTDYVVTRWYRAPEAILSEPGTSKFFSLVLRFFSFQKWQVFLKKRNRFPKMATVHHFEKVPNDPLKNSSLVASFQGFKFWVDSAFSLPLLSSETTFWGNLSEEKGRVRLDPKKQVG